MEELDETTTCPVCYQEFSENENTPRILPCSHTMCQPCLTELSRSTGRRGRRYVVCVECRKKHAIQTFPQNKYILKLLETKHFNMCQVHGRELSLYCKEKNCSKAICPICLIEDHIGHQLADVIDQEKEMLTEKVKDLMDNLKGEQKKLANADREIREKNQYTLSKLKHEKKRMVDVFNQLIDQVTEEGKVEETKINRRLTVIASHLNELGSAGGQIEGRVQNVTFRNKLKSSVDTIEQKKREATVQYKYLEYNAAEHSGSDRMKLFGRLEEKIASEESAHEDQANKETWRAAIDIQNLKFYETLSNGTVATIELMKTFGNVLVQYGATGKVMNSYPISEAVGMVEVKVGHKQCLALSHAGSRIDFRDVENLGKVVCSHKCTPWRMCTATPTTLLYLDTEPKNGVLEVKWLDCSTIPPRPHTHRTCIMVQDHTSVDHMCCSEKETRHRLLIGTDDKCLHTYNTRLDKLMSISK